MTTVELAPFGFYRPDVVRRFVEKLEVETGITLAEEDVWIGEGAGSYRVILKGDVPAVPNIGFDIKIWSRMARDFRIKIVLAKEEEGIRYRAVIEITGVITFHQKQVWREEEECWFPSTNFLRVGG